MSVDNLARAMAKKMQGGNNKYTTNSPIPQDCGGIKSGTTYNNASITDVLNDLLYPYMTPGITFTSIPSGGYQEYGTNISSIQLNSNITKKSNNITKIEYYKNGSMINKNNTPNPNGGTDSYTDSTGINNTTTYQVKVYDGQSIMNSSNIVFNYVYPMYIGSVVDSNPTETDIKSMTKKITEKSNQSLLYTINNSRFCFAYPTSYGNLTSIKDPNNFEMISSFTKTTVDFTMLDNKVINYTIYTLNNTTTQSNFNMTYIF